MTDQDSLNAAVGPGAVFGSYRVISELGRGGMGVVFLSEHTIMGRQAAVKVLLPEYSGREDLVARFFNEARAAARLDHPAFVEVFDCGVNHECAYIVMEYIAGESLTACLNREGRLPVARAVSLARTLAEAMSVAHDHGIIHRDLKPDNIILTNATKLSRVGPHPLKILDFGIAKLSVTTSTTGMNRMTRTGTLMGTPLYMSPEQCRGSGTVDARSDIYSLGCILYAMLTGTPPFVRDGDGVILVAHIVDPVPPLEQHGVNVPPALEAALMKALAKEPEGRQQTMAAFVAELIAADNSPGYETMQGRAITSGHTTAVPEASGNAKLIATPVLKASSTTFSRTSGEVTAAVGETQVTRRRHPMLLGGAVIGLVAGVTAAILVARGGASRPRLITPTPVVAAPAPPPPRPIEAPPPLPAPPAPPAKVELKLTSNPARARVLRASDRAVLGSTPLHLEIDRQDALDVVVEKAGFKSQTIRVNLDRNVEQVVTLQKRTPRPVVIDSDESRKL